jgi:hypothetical protein
MKDGNIGELTTDHVSTWIVAHEIANGFDAKSGFQNFGGAVAYDRRNLVL